MRNPFRRFRHNDVIGHTALRLKRSSPLLGGRRRTFWPVVKLELSEDEDAALSEPGSKGLYVREPIWSTQSGQAQLQPQSLRGIYTSVYGGPVLTTFAGHRRQSVACTASPCRDSTTSV